MPDYAWKGFIIFIVIISSIVAKSNPRFVRTEELWLA